MMNKEYYKRTFSNVRPSEEAMERIFDMTKSKPKRIRFKGLIAVAAVIAILLCGTLSANAATDGKLFTGVKALASADEVKLAKKENDDDTLLKRIKVIFNGEEVSLDEYIITTNIQSGESTDVKLDLPDEMSVEVEEIGDDAVSVDIFYNTEAASDNALS